MSEKYVENLERNFLGDVGLWLTASAHWVFYWVSLACGVNRKGQRDGLLAWDYLVCFALSVRFGHEF
jgi:hypothetical protein